VRLLVISDIHGNIEALEACLAAAPAFDHVLNLGDVVGYGANPNETVERSKALGKIFVRGNHDKACSGGGGLEYFNPIAASAALWTQKTLTPENLQWVKDLPRGPIPVEPRVRCVHGSPLDEDEYIIVMRDAIEPLNKANVPITLFGHTHIQGGFAMEDERQETLRPMYKEKDKFEGLRLALRPGSKYLLNPGSVGQPRDGDWRAAFAVLDLTAYNFTCYRVPYNVKLAQEKILAAKLPERLATRLAEGR
jgi:predicted phosphodiesterase